MPDELAAGRSGPNVKQKRSRGGPLRTLLFGLGMGALLYVAIIALGVTYSVGPAAGELQHQSASVLVAFRESRGRTEVLDSTLTAMWSHLSDSAMRSRHSLKKLRRMLDAVAAQPATSEALSSRNSAPAELRTALAVVGNRDAAMYNAMSDALKALESQDTASARHFLRRADSLEGPRNAAVSNATLLALEDVNRHEAKLDTAAGRASRLVWAWLVIGALAIPVLAVVVRTRLYSPLAAMDRGLARVAAGDLSAHFVIERDDELGRLGAHFNHMTAVLRQRALEEDQRMADRTAARTRLILDSALDAVAVVDHHGLVREWNPQAEVMFGWTRDEVIGQSVAERVFAESIINDYKNPVLSGASEILNKRVEAVASRKDGRTFPVEVAITPLPGGPSREFSVFVRDISERHQAQAALAQSEARYRAAFEQAAVGMIEICTDGTLLRVNRAFADIVGRPAAELVGRPFLELTHTDDRAADARAFESLVGGSVPFAQREKRYLRKDNAFVWAQITSALVRDSDGAPTYVLSVIQDLTERKRLEHDLAQVQKMDAVGSLAGGIAHDFNNLLAGIMGYADLLHHAADATPRVRADAAAIVATAQRGADLAQNLLTLARRSPSKAERVEINTVVAEVKELVARTFDRRIDLRLDLSRECAVVLGDRSHLSNAILNLAVNGRDAMVDGGRLTFSTECVRLDATFCARYADTVTPGEYIAVSVRDTGTGVTPEVRARMFDPFFTTKEVGKGTGLGLAMVYGAVRSHNGMVVVESEPGRGALFTLYFPRAANTNDARPMSMRAVAMGEGRVLLADDESVVRDVATRMIERLGYTVHAVGNGELAVEQVRAEPEGFDIIILDGDMPKMTGREAARRIRQLNAHVPIVLATGYLSPTDGESLDAYGFTQAVGKPYSLSTLSQILKEQLVRA